MIRQNQEMQKEEKEESIAFYRIAYLQEIEQILKKLIKGTIAQNAPTVDEFLPFPSTCAPMLIPNRFKKAASDDLLDAKGVFCFTLFRLPKTWLFSTARFACLSFCVLGVLLGIANVLAATSPARFFWPLDPTASPRREKEEQPCLADTALDHQAPRHDHTRTSIHSQIQSFLSRCRSANLGYILSSSPWHEYL